MFQSMTCYETLTLQCVCLCVDDSQDGGDDMMLELRLMLCYGMYMNGCLDFNVLYVLV